MALAAGQLGLGKNARALATIDDLMAILEPESRDDFSNHQLFDLAKGLRGRALLAYGCAADSRSDAHGVLPQFVPGRLLTQL
ncbi:MAG: hypothetical protein HY825_10340 [Acidobacteria bacterium]|nr:hypothetical protein [Acidobacteriota bacterium]